MHEWRVVDLVVFKVFVDYPEPKVLQSEVNVYGFGGILVCPIILVQPQTEVLRCQGDPLVIADVVD